MLVRLALFRHSRRPFELFSERFSSPFHTARVLQVHACRGGGYKRDGNGNGCSSRLFASMVGEETEVDREELHEDRIDVSSLVEDVDVDEEDSMDSPGMRTRSGRKERRKPLGRPKNSRNRQIRTSTQPRTIRSLDELAHLTVEDHVSLSLSLFDYRRDKKRTMRLRARAMEIAARSDILGSSSSAITLSRGRKEVFTLERTWANNGTLPSFGGKTVAGPFFFDCGLVDPLISHRRCSLTEHARHTQRQEHPHSRAQEIEEEQELRIQEEKRESLFAAELSRFLKTEPEMTRLFPRPPFWDEVFPVDPGETRPFTLRQQSEDTQRMHRHRQWNPSIDEDELDMEHDNGNEIDESAESSFFLHHPSDFDPDFDSSLLPDGEGSEQRRKRRWPSTFSRR